MDHAEARERLLDLALEPGLLRGLDLDPSPTATGLRGHVTACAECRADLGTWVATYAALDVALRGEPDDGAARALTFGELADSAGTVTPPAGLRARTLAAAAEGAPVPIRRAETPRRWLRPAAWLAMAAAVVLFVGGAAIVVDRTQQLDLARADAAALAGLTGALDRILQDPGHQVVGLKTPAGTPAGTVSWSASDGAVAVLSTALQAPPTGQVYRCWLQQGGTRVPVGEMQFSGSTAYWAGSLASWGWPPAPGDTFTVSLEPTAGGGAGTPALVGTF